MVKVDPFVHLHNHSGYSLLDGLSSIESMVNEAVKLGQPAIALTDHGSMGGAYELWDRCRRAGIKPIVGTEFYVSPGDHRDKSKIRWGTEEQQREDVGGAGAYTHLTVLATTAGGLRNLFALHAASFAEGFYSKPRISRNALINLSDGLVVLSGCLGGEFQTRLKLGQVGEAKRYAAEMRDALGDKFYIEMMDHGLEVEDTINPLVFSIAQELDIPIVATNDNHYTREADSDIHDALLCLQTGQRVATKKRFRFDGAGYYLRSREEMSALPLPDSALQRTCEITDRVGSYDSVFEEDVRLPGLGDDNKLIRQTVADWLYWKLGVDGATEYRTYEQRAEYELDTIIGRGTAGYFTVLADVVARGKDRGIRVGPGRGSAGGSLVAYALGITELDPIREGLLFERFLNPARVGLPDIDIDIPDDRRDEFIEIVREVHGNDNVAQVGTYGTVASKSAIHDAARVLGHSRDFSNTLASQLPPARFGRLPSLSEHPYWSDPSPTGPTRETMELAAGLESAIRSKGVHAAGVVVSPTPLANQLPLWIPTGETGWVTAFSNPNDYPILDKMGILKYDVLGLKTLGVIDECLRMVAPRDVQLPSASADCTDTKTFELLRSGHTLGVFQLDSPGMQQLLRALKPDRFADISACLALYRPGPIGVNAHHSYAKRKNGRERVSYPHGELEEALRPVLEDTYGLIVYQEQVLETLRVVGGYDYASAGLIFDAMRKKNTEKMLASKPDFSSRMKAEGYSEDCCEVLWATLVPFSDYSFNRAHTTGYGLVAYWTAYLKANYPTEYMAALLTRTPPTTKDGVKKAHEYINEAERMGISVLSPDINESSAGWTPTSTGIRYGLTTIKGVADKAFDALQTKRPYKSLDDMLRRAPAKALNVGVLRSLVRAGAVDSLEDRREELDLDLESLVEQALAERKMRSKGQVGILSTTYTASSRGLYSKGGRQEWEMDLLGVHLTQTEITLRLSRWLTPEEFEYLNSVCSEHPGSSPLHLNIGKILLRGIAMVGWSESIKRAFTSLGVIEVTES